MRYSSGLCVLIGICAASVAFGQEMQDVLHVNNNYNEVDCLKAINFDATEVNASHASFVGLAMKKGFWKCAKELSTIVQGSGIDVRNVFDFESRLIMKEISDLRAAVESHKSTIRPTINPAYQWAQSTDEIFINVKFSHKIDAPATLNVETEEVKWTNKTLSLRASDGRKTFSLDIDFLRDIVPESSSYSMASVGRMTFTIRKSIAPSNWPRLTKSKKKANNVHFWWELHEKHSEALEALNEDADEEEEVHKKKTEKMKAKSSTKAALEAAKSVSVSSPPPPDVEPLNAAAEAVKEEIRLAEKSHREAMKLLDDEVMTRKREVDKRCRDDKEAIDIDATSRKNDLNAQRDALLTELGAKLNTVLQEEGSLSGEKEL